MILALRTLFSLGAARTRGITMGKVEVLRSVGIDCQIANEIWFSAFGGPMLKN
jgi:hypothetical protein